MLEEGTLLSIFLCLIVGDQLTRFILLILRSNCGVQSAKTGMHSER